MKNAITLTNLQKTYAASGKSAEKVALHGIDLTIPQGSMFGLLGPNGAGKSTMINILAGLVVKTGGTANIWGYDIDNDNRNAKRSIGIVAQELTFDPFFTPRQILEIQAGYYGLTKDERWTDELLDLVGLTDKADAWMRSLSGGMKRRLMVAKAMVHRPPILVLDEPTAGVDVELRRQLWANVRKLNEQGTTILLTTHYLEEAEELCDQIAIINHGHIIANETTEQLLSRIDGKEIRFTVTQDVSTLPKKLHDAKAINAHSFSLCYKPAETPAGAVIERVQAAGLTVTDITTVQSDLEDIFIQLTQAA